MTNNNIKEVYMKDVIVITGGSNGLGNALVEYSLNNGLIVCNLDKETLEYLVALLRKENLVQKICWKDIFKTRFKFNELGCSW